MSLERLSSLQLAAADIATDLHLELRTVRLHAIDQPFIRSARGYGALATPSGSSEVRIILQTTTKKIDPLRKCVLVVGRSERAFTNSWRSSSLSSPKIQNLNQVRPEVCTKQDFFMEVEDFDLT